jgi:hypothetical protein
MRRLRPHLTYANVMVTLLAFVVLGGGAAYAANTIGSSDIINESILSQDLKNGAVQSADVANGTLQGADIASRAIASAKVVDESLTGGDVADGSLTSSDVADESLSGTDILNGTVHGQDIVDESLTGNDVVESTLGEVPSARIGGLGRWTGGGSCDPESENYVDCVIVTLNLPSPARVLLIGQGSADIEADANSMGGVCELVSEVGRIVPNSLIEIDAFDFSVGTKNFGLTAVTGVFPAGSHDFAVDCNQNEEFGAIQYFDMGISAVAISPN